MRNQTGALAFVGSFHANWPELALPEVAFAGRSNVGKSSALNTLLGRKHAARVSATPGRTQAINLFRVGTGCVFADLPGYGFARVPPKVQAQFKVMIESYLGERSTLRLVVVLIDARRDPQPMDGQLIASLQDVKLPLLVVATKVDKLKKAARSRQLASLRRAFNLDPGQPVPFSSVTGEGKDQVWNHIESACRGAQG